MQKVELKIKKLDPEAKIPEHKSEQAACFDIHALSELTLEPGETTKVPTGIALEIPLGYYLRIEDRSGLALKKIHKVGGIIDSDYRGEIFIMLHNSGKEPYKIEKHDRIAQGAITPSFKANFQLSETLSETERGEQGFHSTGKQ